MVLTVTKWQSPPVFVGYTAKTHSSQI